MDVLEKFGYFIEVLFLRIKFGEEYCLGKSLYIGLGFFSFIVFNIVFWFIWVLYVNSI